MPELADDPLLNVCFPEKRPRLDFAISEESLKYLPPDINQLLIQTKIVKPAEPLDVPAQPEGFELFNLLVDLVSEDPKEPLPQLQQTQDTVGNATE